MSEPDQRDPSRSSSASAVTAPRRPPMHLDGLSSVRPAPRPSTVHGRASRAARSASCWSSVATSSPPAFSAATSSGSCSDAGADGAQVGVDRELVLRTRSSPRSRRELRRRGAGSSGPTSSAMRCCELAPRPSSRAAVGASAAPSATALPRRDRPTGTRAGRRAGTRCPASGHRLDPRHRLAVERDGRVDRAGAVVVERDRARRRRPCSRPAARRLPGTTPSQHAATLTHSAATIAAARSAGPQIALQVVRAVTRVCRCRRARPAAARRPRSSGTRSRRLRRRSRSCRRRGIPSRGSSPRAGPRPCAGSPGAAAGRRARGRSPSSRAATFASGVRSKPRPCDSSCSRTRSTSRSTISVISVVVSSWKTMTSSMRLRNSGRKWRLSSSCTFSFIFSYVTCSSALTNPTLALRRSAVPRFDVMMITVFLKSTVRPCASVRRPSSRIWSRVLKTSGWAFSISSNSTTENGLRRTASVS